jgi:hypothetical protein
MGQKIPRVWQGHQPHENIDLWLASKGRGDLTACFSVARLGTYLVKVRPCGTPISERLLRLEPSVMETRSQTCKKSS